MKAYLLAAGLGSRLKPITDKIPKCLVPISGHPMLDWWAKLFLESGVSEVLINTHYMADQVHDYIEEYNAKNTGLKFVETYEEELIGSGGTVYTNRDFVKDEESFLICYADNLTDVNLPELIKFHNAKGAPLTMALFHTNVPKQCGIAELNDEGRIVAFIEKPENPVSDLANAGIYVASKEVFNDFPDAGFSDIGKDVLPKLVGRMYGWEIPQYLIDIGTMPNYEKAQADWKYDYDKDKLCTSFS